MEKKTRKKVGRPSSYTPELAEKICDLIRGGKSERKISAMKGMPSTVTLRRWKEEHPEFCIQSARAREESAEMFRDKALAIAMDVHTVAKQCVQSHIQALIKERDDPDRDENGNVIKPPKMQIPQGYVEAQKLAIQELNREAAIRDDSRFGDRKTVKLDTTNTESAGMAEVYARMKAAQEKPDGD